MLNEPPVSISRVSVIGSDCVWCGLLRRNNTVTVMYADERGEHIASFARETRGFNVRALRHVNGINDVLQTNLELLKRRIDASTSARRPGSEEAKSRGEKSRINE